MGGGFQFGYFHRSPSSRKAGIEIEEIEKIRRDICRLPHGRRGLKYWCVWRLCGLRRRLPHGRRGLKLCYEYFYVAGIQSPSSRKAGIEIPEGTGWKVGVQSRLPHGRRGLKFMLHLTWHIRIIGRLPHGRRGLKS